MAREGNCWTCGSALHTKHEVTLHPVLGTDQAGNPVRGLAQRVNVCGKCLSSGQDHAMSNAAKTVWPKKAEKNNLIHPGATHSVPSAK